MRLYQRGLVLAAFVVGASALGDGRRRGTPRPADWQSGDIVFMNGNSWRSGVVRLLQGGSSDFTHVGLVSVHDGETWIIQASPTAGADGTGRVIEERWDVALGPDRVGGGAVYRLRDDDPSRREAARLEAERYARAGLPFDHAFELSTADRLYCTELIWRAYQHAGVELRVLRPGKYLLPADLARSAQLREVSSF